LNAENLEICKDLSISTECIIEKVLFNRNSFPALQDGGNMTPKNFLTAIACACLLLLSCNRPPLANTSAEVEILQNLSNEWCAAIAVGDVEKIMSFFVPESVEMDQDNPIIIGIPDIKKAQQSWLSDTLVRSSFKFSFEKIEISYSGDLAWSRGKGSFSMNTEKGPVEIVEKSINIWKKIDGKWKVIVMISNTDKPEEPVIGTPLTSNEAPGLMRKILYTKTKPGRVLSEYTLSVDDQAGHKLVQVCRIDEGKTSDPEFALIEERVHEHGDVRPGHEQYSGYSTYFMRNGDRVFISYSGNMDAGKPMPGEKQIIGSGTIEIIGGTGRYKNITGKGIYRLFKDGPILEENILEVSF
jgi:ketosteroid isomerase-like protein